MKYAMWNKPKIAQMGKYFSNSQMCQSLWWSLYRHFYLPKSQTLHTLKWVWRVGECKMQITSESRHTKQFRTQSGKKNHSKQEILHLNIQFYLILKKHNFNHDDGTKKVIAIFETGSKTVLPFKIVQSS